MRNVVCDNCKKGVTVGTFERPIGWITTPNTIELRMQHDIDRRSIFRFGWFYTAAFCCKKCAKEWFNKQIDSL